MHPGSTTSGHPNQIKHAAQRLVRAKGDFCHSFMTKIVKLRNSGTLSQKQTVNMIRTLSHVAQPAHAHSCLIMHIQLHMKREHPHSLAPFIAFSSGGPVNIYSLQVSPVKKRSVYIHGLAFFGFVGSLPFCNLLRDVPPQNELWPWWKQNYAPAPHVHTISMLPKKAHAILGNPRCNNATIFGPGNAHPIRIVDLIGPWHSNHGRGYASYIYTYNHTSLVMAP